jgi:hypothetical protein
MPCLGFKGQHLRATIVPIFMLPAALRHKLQFEDSLSRAGIGRLAGAFYTHLALRSFRYCSVQAKIVSSAPSAGKYCDEP